jgi:hypothetical protein
MHMQYSAEFQQQRCRQMEERLAKQRSKRRTVEVHIKELFAELQGNQNHAQILADELAMTRAALNAAEENLQQSETRMQEIAQQAHIRAELAKEVQVYAGHTGYS